MRVFAIVFGGRRLEEVRLWESSRTERIVASKTQVFAFGLTAAMSRSSPQGITDVVELVAQNQYQQLRQKKRVCDNTGHEI